MSILEKTQKQINQIKEVREAYKDYCEREFSDDYKEETGSILGIMYTNINNEEYEVQVSYDLENQMLATTIKDSNHEYTFKEKYPYHEMADDFRKDSFDGWYSYAHDVCEERFSLDLEW